MTKVKIISIPFFFFSAESGKNLFTVFKTVKDCMRSKTQKNAKDKIPQIPTFAEHLNYIDREKMSCAICRSYIETCRVLHSNLKSGQARVNGSHFQVSIQQTYRSAAISNKSARLET